MRKEFNHLDVIDDLAVPERQTVDGRRIYVTPNGDSYPSITSILGSQPKPSLDAWRERVGKEEADKLLTEEEIQLLN